MMLACDVRDVDRLVLTILMHVIPASLKPCSCSTLVPHLVRSRARRLALPRTNALSCTASTGRTLRCLSACRMHTQNEGHAHATMQTQMKRGVAVQRTLSDVPTSGPAQLPFSLHIDDMQGRRYLNGIRRRSCAVHHVGCVTVKPPLACKLSGRDPR